MTGHGGDGFLKFQDSEEITNIELADAFEQVLENSYYNWYNFLSIDTATCLQLFEIGYVRSSYLFINE